MAANSEIRGLTLEGKNDDAFALSRGEAKELLAEAEADMASIVDKNIEEMAVDADQSDRDYAAARAGLLLISCIGILGAAGLAWFVVSGINRSLNRVIGQIDEGSGQVAAASDQVSAASQSLAEGASEQAASIEETSSSLEELSSMTRQNAENANRANQLVEETKQVVKEADSSMDRLVESMGAVSKASEETSKIIKTIDEIAFQTNLLALNAAVEAARAGEAGAGFAVVADEVRNLALRATEAAKNTAELIEDTTGKIKEGSALVEATNQSFSQVSESSNKVAELVAEISAASGEQAEGIDQINTAISDVDKVTQQNASNAEESASASEELNAQARGMQASVKALHTLVAGRKAIAGGRTEEGARGERLASGSGHAALPAATNDRSQEKGSAARKTSPGEVDPDRAIPMGDEDFRDMQ